MPLFDGCGVAEALAVETGAAWTGVWVVSIVVGGVLLELDVVEDDELLEDAAAGSGDGVFVVLPCFVEVATGVPRVM
jgi:hypothetical protein